MSKFTEIICKYTLGEISLEDANAALETIDTIFRLSPERHQIKPEDVGRLGLLDTGTVTLDLVEVKDGKLMNSDCGDMFALCFLAGKVYEVKGTTLVM